MILVIPSFELRNGACTFCIKGDLGTEDYYQMLQSNPLEFSYLIRRENSKSLHILDLDSFETSNNIINSNSILYIANNIDIPVQLYTDFKSIDECEMYLENGIYRIIINNLIYKSPQSITELINKYSPSRIAAYINTDERNVISSNLSKNNKDVEIGEYIKNLGISRIYYDENQWNILLGENDFSNLKDFAIKTSLKVTVVNGITKVEELWQLNNLYPQLIDSVIIGKPLYENIFPCQNIWRKIEAKLDN